MEQQAKIEHLSQPNESTIEEDSSLIREGNSRTKTFIYTFLLSLIVGTIINYSRPPVYLSSATLLTSAATAVDQISGEVDLQNVTIQKQKLLGVELLTETLSRIKSLEENDLELSNISLADVRTMLKVEPIEETNLLSMSAKGSTPEVLPVVINTWIDVYLEARALSVKNAADDTVGRIKSELSELEHKIIQTRKELDAFRIENDISSIIREENELPATLIKLTEAYNNANEEVLKSKAKLDAVNQAIASGQAVVPKLEQTSLSDLERELRELKATLAEFDKHFTRDYLQYKGSMKYIPEQIKKLTQQIRQKRKLGKSIVKTEASQEYYAAKQVVEKIREQLDEHKIKATNFTALFSKHQKLVDDLESMDLMARETKDRLTNIQSKQFDKYPQVDVVERASINRQAISPNYNTGLLTVLASSLFLAFFMAWLRDYLMQGQAKTDEEKTNFPEADLVDQAHQNVVSMPQERRHNIKHNRQNELTQILTHQKLTNSDLDVLLVNGDKNTQQLILLVLSGLTLEEISNLGLLQIRNEATMIRLLGNNPRDIPVGKALRERLKESLENGELWEHQHRISIEEMNAMLYCSAVDIGLDSLDGTLAETLRQSYIIYLVEQGLRLTSLTHVVGHLSPLELAGYAVFSPAGGGCDIGQIELIHPLCN